MVMTGIMKRLPLLVASLTCVGRSHAVQAQRVDDSAPTITSMFSRARSTTVNERLVPGYTRSGVRFGRVLVYPEITAGGVVNDNLYSSDADRVADVAATLEPRVSASLDSSHLRIDLLGDVLISRYASRTTEDSTQYTTRANGRFDLGAGLTISASLGRLRQGQKRSDPGAIAFSITPILLDVAETSGQLVWEHGRIRLRATGSYNDFRFESGRLADGTVLPQDYRNRKLIRGSSQLQYAVTPDLALGVEGSYSKNDYKRTSLTVFDQDSTRIELLGGASFEFTDLLRGEVGIGYLNLQYDAPGLKNFSGIGGRLQLEYLPTQLTTVTLRLSRTIEEAGQPLAPSYVRTTIGLTVDHELYRNLMLSASAGYQDNRFREPARSDRRPTFGASARLRLTNMISFVGRYDYLHAATAPSTLGRTINVNTASVGINVGL